VAGTNADQQPTVQGKVVEQKAKGRQVDPPEGLLAIFFSWIGRESIVMIASLSGCCVNGTADQAWLGMWFEDKGRTTTVPCVRDYSAGIKFSI
jgi:hypothetical protein